MDWVTDPEAIEAILALKALAVGDVVRLKELRTVDIINSYQDGAEAELAVVYPKDHTGPWTSPIVACIRGSGLAGKLFICEHNIAAWRRPGVHKEQ